MTGDFPGWTCGPVPCNGCRWPYGGYVPAYPTVPYLPWWRAGVCPCCGNPWHAFPPPTVTCGASDTVNVTTSDKAGA